MKVLLGVDLRLDDHRWLIERAGLWAHIVGGTLDLIYVKGATGNVATLTGRLAQMLQRLPKHLHGRAYVEEGPLAATILKAAKDADLLIVGSGEPAGLEGLLRGPLANRLLNDAPCAVLIPRGTSGPGASPRLLVGVDVNSPTTGGVLDLADQWAERLQGKVDALYAVNERIPRIANKAVRDAAERQWHLGREDIRLSVQSLLDKHVREPFRGAALLGPGAPEDALIHQSSQADVVLVGNRPRTGIQGFFLGPVGQAVVRQSRCDVLSLPSKNQ